MLNAMRKRAGGFAAKLLLVLLIASFAVWGVEDMLRNTGKEGALASVDGQEIPRSAFQREYNNQLNRARTMLGKNYSPELVRMLGIERQVLEQLIMTELMKRETQNLGLLPSDQAVLDDIRINPAFKNDKGAFDKSKFIAVLRNNGLTEQTFISEMKRQKANEALLTALGAAAPIDDLMVATQYEAESEERVADVAIIAPSQIKNIKTPDDDEVETFYKQHASSFNLPESRTLSYVTVKRDALLAQVPVNEADIKAAYKERAEMFGGAAAPYEKVKDDIEKELKAEHAEEAIGKFATQLEDLLAGGSTLAEAAKELKLTYATLGPVTQNGTAPDGSKLILPPYDNFLDVAFRTEEGNDSPLTPAKDGTYFLVRAEKVTPEQPEPLKDVRDKVIAAWKQQETMKAVKARAEALAADAKDGKDAAATFAREGVTLSSAGIIKRTDQKSSTNLALPSGLVQELFAIRKDQSTGAYPAAEGSYMIAVLKERREPRKVTPEMLKNDPVIKNLRTKLEEEAKRMAVEEYLAHLRRKYHVIINDDAITALASGER